jgi:hypothetical protein
MLAEAWYDNGKIEFARNYRFRHNMFKVRVEVPDDEVVNEGNSAIPVVTLTKAQEMLAKLDAIRNAPLSTDGDNDEMTEKQRQRMEAFELRAQMRTEQGRPV